MAHIDEYLAPCAAYAFEVAAEFQTRVATRRNKYESRNADWDQVRHVLTAPFSNLLKDGFLEIKRMFLACRGRLHTFKFEDPADHEAEDEIFGVGDGLTTVFQLRKISTAGAESYEREVYLPRAGATFTANGVPVVPAYSQTTGQVTFAPAPTAGHVLRWTGEFDLKVRFQNDSLGFSIDNKTRRGSFVMNGSVELLEVPE